MKPSIAILILACSALSCKKKSQVAPQDVVMTISAPQEAQVFHNNDSIHIKGAITYSNIVHGYEIVVKDTATNMIVFDYAEHIHDDSFLIDQSFVISGTDTLNLKLELHTEIDHNGNQVEKDLYFKFEP